MTHRPPVQRLMLHACAAALVVLAVGPALWLVGVALSPTSVPVNRLPSPGELTAANFQGVWRDADLLRPLVNSVVVTVAQAALNVVLAALAAYPLARMEFRGRSFVFVLILSTLMIPEQVIVVPLFRTIVGLGLYDTLVAVVLPFSVTAFGIYMCRQAFLAIPVELEEAARVDGATALHVWWHVMLPLARPALATLAVFSVIGAWSNLLWPLIVLQDTQNYTLPVAISQLLGMFATNVRYAYAASVLAMIPVLIVFVISRRYFERGMLGGAVKG